MKATLLVFAFAVALSLALVLLLDPAESCNYVNAYDVQGNVPDSAYITITGTTTECGTPVCGRDTLQNCYSITIDNACVPFGAGANGKVAGNNLSGHYHVTRRPDGCLVLCTCSG